MQKMNKKNDSVFTLSCYIAPAIIFINPMKVINDHWENYMSASFRLCFEYNQMCDIDSYAELAGSAFPLTLITFILLLLISTEEKLKGFFVLLTCYTISNFIHATHITTH